MYLNFVTWTYGIPRVRGRRFFMSSGMKGKKNPSLSDLITKRIMYWLLYGFTTMVHTVDFAIFLKFSFYRFCFLARSKKICLLFIIFPYEFNISEASAESLNVRVRFYTLIVIHTRFAFIIYHSILARKKM